jgi:DNA repair exonuclease SbcCD nuclease subunit
MGYEQYKNHVRYEDFSKVFIWLLNFAKEQEVDFVIISGDLFHKRTVDPMAMRVVIQAIQDANLEIVIVEGNHEKSYFIEKESWIDYLGSKVGYAELLDGNEIRIGDARILGLKYAGSNINTEVLDFVNHLCKADLFTILVFNKVNYVALGHIHKPYVYDNYAYNPGSPENVSADEVLYPNRGAILVTVNHDNTFSTEYVNTPRREFHRFNIDITGFTKPEWVYDAVNLAMKEDVGDQAVIDFTLSGEISFARSDINIQAIQDTIVNKVNPLIVHVSNKATPVGFGITVDETQSKDIEISVMTQVVMRDARYRDDAQSWAESALTIKDLALLEDHDGIVTYVNTLV